MTPRTTIRTAALAAWILGCAAAAAQNAAPVETAPLPPPAGSAAAPSPPPAPPATNPQAPSPPAPVPPPAAGAPAAPPTAGGARQTLVEKPGDPSDVDEVTLAGRPAAIVSGQSTWDKAVDNLKASFRRLEDELRRTGVAPTGRPIAVFTRTDDDGFRYDAMIPVERAPDAAPAGASPELRFGTTPAGRALRFVHKGAYDDIDTTYETITAYLDAKGIVVQDAFAEEYASDLTDGSDAGLEVNIFALPR